MLYLPSPAKSLDYDTPTPAASDKSGRVKGTREIVVRPNYVMVYRVSGKVVEVLRVLHVAQQWPRAAEACFALA